MQKRQPKTATRTGARVERPIRVKVAEALGYECRQVQSVWVCRREGELYEGFVPEFEKDWKTLGPIITGRHISVVYHPKWNGYSAEIPGGEYSGAGTGPYAPLLAVCDLIVEMDEAGVWRG